MEVIVFLFVAGAVLLLLEPLMPYIVAGTIGLGCWALATALTYLRFGFATGNWALAAVLSLGLAGTWWYLKRMPATRMGRTVQSDHVVPTETRAKTHLLDRAGVTVTPLRPGGIAEVAGERVDVVSEGEWLESGRTVKVIAIEGARILVRPA
jgi:membrane-bound serine protease (ClpP class)